MAIIYTFTHEKILNNFEIFSSETPRTFNNLITLYYQAKWTKSDLQLLKLKSCGYDTFSIHQNTFFAPHWHTGEEKRLFLAGTGTFYIPTKNNVLIITCSIGDIVTLQPGTIHWFNGQAGLTALRFFGDNIIHASYYHNIPPEYIDLFSSFDDIFPQYDGVHLMN
jgi:cupin superfamily acireductone dioxygenase involved in methionine salvage